MTCVIVWIGGLSLGQTHVVSTSCPDRLDTNHHLFFLRPHTLGTEWHQRDHREGWPVCEECRGSSGAWWVGSFELFFTFIPLDYDVVGGFSPEVTRWRLNDFGWVRARRPSQFQTFACSHAAYHQLLLTVRSRPISSVRYFDKQLERRERKARHQENTCDGTR